MSEEFGTRLPALAERPPGPISRALAARLSVVESSNITQVEPEPPIFWAESAGANVRDVDGNVYVDLTAGFSVAAAGHANPRVAQAMADQAARLPHALGDVYPAEVKLLLLERLAALAPGRLGVSILASAGAEAVEAALKTTVLHTGRPGIVAFENGYHGLTYGALAATWRRDFRQLFLEQLYDGVRFAPYPGPQEDGSTDREDEAVESALFAVGRAIEDGAAAGAPVGGVLVEPVQGRGGLVVPPMRFLPGLRRLCDERGLVLIFDEVYTGFGRTGRWFACEHAGVVPDILVVGKALSGVLPLSAAIGTPEVMAAWPPSRGEAIHTSTFLGNPIACAAALAQLDEIEGQALPERAAELGERVRARFEALAAEYASSGEQPERKPSTGREDARATGGEGLVVRSRGIGLMRGLELFDGDGDAATGVALDVVARCLQRGVLLLAEGPHANVLACTPPLVITERQLDHALDVIAEELAAASA